MIVPNMNHKLTKPQLLGLLGLFLFALHACSKESKEDKTDKITVKPAPNAPLYFPPVGSVEWDTVSMADLNWNADAGQPLRDFLSENKTKAFIILKDGKIALETYFGTFTKDSVWYWASAGKTLTSFTVGIAQEKNLLDIANKTSLYLGEGWTSAPLEKEDLITVRHQLTMTSGLNDTSFDCISSNCLEYLADAGSRWAYHNGPYTLLQSVVSAAVQTSWSAFFNTHLRNKIGMNGVWSSTNGTNNLYFSDARSMARFGLLNLNNGEWDGETILGDTDYLKAMKTTSQNLNMAYGYLWWLNDKESYMAPAVQATFNGELIPNAPKDTYAGLGKNNQKLYVAPGRGLVIVRMGEDTGQSPLGPSSFDNQLWEKINDLID